MECLIRIGNEGKGIRLTAPVVDRKKAIKPIVVLRN